MLLSSRDRLPGQTVRPCGGGSHTHQSQPAWILCSIGEASSKRDHGYCHSSFSLSTNNRWCPKGAFFAAPPTHTVLLDPGRLPRKTPFQSSPQRLPAIQCPAWIKCWPALPESHGTQRKPTTNHLYRLLACFSPPQQPSQMVPGDKLRRPKESVTCGQSRENCSSCQDQTVLGIIYEALRRFK
jgi:hypothetical protein